MSTSARSRPTDLGRSNSSRNGSTIPPSIGLGLTLRRGLRDERGYGSAREDQDRMVAEDAAKQNVTTVQAELVSRIWSTLMAWLRGETSLGRREFRTTRRV